MSEVVAEGVVRIRTDTTGTSSSALKHEGEKAGKAYSGGVSHAVKGIAATLGGAFAAEKLVEFAKSSVEAASEDEAGQRRLALAMKNSAGARDEDVKATEEWIKKQSLAKGISDDDLRPALQQLVQSTGSVTKARKELTVAEDVSAGTGKNLTAVSMAIMRANNGTTAGLSRLGIKTKQTTVDTLGMEKAHLAVTAAQEGVAAATKKYGANTDEANAATVKLQEAQANLHKVQTTGKTTTLSLDDALKSMSKTYGGQAKDKAESFEGTMARLKVTIHEGEEAIGGKLLPVLQRFGDWLINKGVPGSERLYHSLKENLAPAFGDVRDVIGFLQPIVEKVIGFLHDNPQTVKTFAIVLGILATAIGVVTLATAALDAVMAINPFTIAAVAIAALAAGLVYAYTHSEKFRTVVQALGTAVTWLWEHAIKPVTGFIIDHWKLIAVVIGTLVGGPIIGALVLLATHFGIIKGAVHLLGQAATWLWNKAFQPAIKFIVDGLAILIDVWGHMLSALGKVPGFGWAKDAGAAMQDAADEARGVADAIKKIPNHKAVHIDLITTTDKSGVVHSSGGGHVPALADGGVVRARPGGTLIRAGEAGQDEAVVPLGRDSRTAGTGAGIYVAGDYVVQAHNYDDLTQKQRRQVQVAAFAGRQPVGASR